MSRIGKLPIEIVQGAEFIMEGNDIKVKGPKGELNYTIPNGVKIGKKESIITVSIDTPLFKNLWGLVRTLINNMIIGVTDGYEKKLKLIGVGYNAKVQGKSLLLNLGYSHPINYSLPEGIQASVEKDPKGNDIVTLGGIDKQLVGEVAAKIRSFRKPEPYKGKGVRYIDEVVKIKAGKTAKK